MRKPNKNLKTIRRQQIINVAVELFAQKNYHEVLMEEVAEKAGMAKGSIYNYFLNKEDLYISIITHRLESLLQLLKERIDTRNTPLINIRRIIIHIYSFMAKYPHFFQIWYREKLRCGFQTNQRVQKLYGEIKNLLEIALERGIAEGIIREHKTDFIGDLLMGMIDAAVLRSHGLTQEQQRVERLMLFEFFLEALGTECAKLMHKKGLDRPDSSGEVPIVT